MDSLILANIRQRPTRTLVSVIGVALGVVLILVNTGLVRGMLNDRSRRERGVGAEIIFSRPGANDILSASGLTLDIRYAERIAKIQGVQVASPIGKYLQKGNAGLGFELVDGIDYPSYSAMSGIKIVDGGVFQADNEVIIDAFKARKSNAKVGSEIEVFGKKLKVAGIYSPESGARVKMSLSALQNYMGSPNKCSWIAVKCEDPAKQEEVQKRINAELPGNTVQLMRDLPSFERAIPGIDGFIKTILVLSTIVSSLVILLAMYTTITERTREIGILKSLGASKRFIIGVIEREAITISLIGVGVGLVAALIIGWGIRTATTLQVEFQWTWILVAALIGLAAGVGGSFYPAVRAANQDAVKALSYE
ncbi:MAG: ABC transporter permease [Acidobacteria bacterium]|nr:ABC transporter permease [Acidobacteriota bacterium]